MMKIKVGFVSTSDSVFIGDIQGQFNRSVQDLKKLSETLGFDLHVVNYSVSTETQAQKAVKECEENNVDFLLLQQTTCSAGPLAPIFASIKNARIGIWAIPEGTCEGPSPYNSFVSLTFFMGIIGHYIKDQEIPVKWFFGNVEDNQFQTRLAVTVKALTAIKSMCHSSIGLIGGISNGFGDLYFDERNIKSLFPGIKIHQYLEYREVRDKAQAFSQGDVLKAKEEFLEGSVFLCKQCEAVLDNNVRLYMGYRDFIKEYGLDAVALNCIYKVQEDFKTNICAIIGQLNDDGIDAACEGDLMGALSMLMLKYLAETQTTLMDFPQFDEKDDSILMWHCGSTAKCFSCDSTFRMEKSYANMPIIRDLNFKPGHVTIARIAGEADTVLLADGRIIDDKKSFLGCGGWIGDLRLNRQSIKALDFVNTVLVRKFQHHYPVVYGDYTKEISEIASWLGLKFIKKVEYQDYFQNRDLL